MMTWKQHWTGFVHLLSTRSTRTGRASLNKLRPQLTNCGAAKFGANGCMTLMKMLRGYASQ
eukprot:1356193-Karenia_brevis.AAC.1